ncbi:MAG: DUF4143 domain-containing protein [Elusimicrobia bacterium]|nr:DUF4143 domain-containing protein [Elusimicrobiota bacterium]
MERPEFIREIRQAFRIHSVVGILGPRQCGKTTLARMIAADHKHFSSPDRPKIKTKFLILGSASRDLIKQSSESLAGRIQFIELTPFNINETGISGIRKLWLRGGFPKSFLARTSSMSSAWRKSFIASYLERDIPALGIQIPSNSLRRFWMMLTHYHGQIFNASEIGSSLGIADTTVKRYLDILSGTFMIRQLYPWRENIAKRQIKSPKIFFRDSGIFHALLGIQNETDILHHPKLGASWEGFALEEIVRLSKAAPEESYFWGTHNKAELDLLIIKDGKRLGYEIKFSDSPKLSKSMHIAMQDLKLNQLTVIFPGNQSFPLAKNVHARGLASLV